MQLGKSSLILLLVVTAAVCILMGMGLPTVGVYLLLSTLAAPPLIELGLQAMPAHLFVLYFGMLSMLTPPVAIAAFVAANMAKAPPMRTGFEAVRIAWPAFVMPFLFVLSPSLILQGEWSDIIPTVLTTLVGVYLVTAGLIGFVFTMASPLVRAGLIVAGMALIWPETSAYHYALVAAGLGLGALVLMHQRNLARHTAPA